MKNVRHFGIVTNNMEKSLHFYRDLLGLKIKREMLEEGKFIDTILGLEKVKVRTIKMAADEGQTLVELLEYQSHKRGSRSSAIRRRRINFAKRAELSLPSKGKERENYEIFDLGASHLAITVNNLHQEYEKLQKEGVEFISSPQISPDGKAKVAFCWDPNSVPIELVEEL